MAQSTGLAVPADPLDRPALRVARRVLLPVVVIVAVAFPFVFTNPATTSIAMFTLIYVGASSAWNMFSGYTGYMALGNAVFYGSGAYFFANITTHFNLAGGVGIFALVPVAGAFAGLVAVPVGWLALRTRRHTFVVITIAIFFIFQLLAYNLHSLTNGSSGMSLPIPPWTAQTYNTYFYLAALVVAVVAIALSWAVRRSAFGLELLAIRDDEDRARGIGVKTTRAKLVTFVLTGFVTGMCGAIYAYYLGSIYPPFAFEAIFDVTIALMAFLGGLGTVSGPVIGALVLEPVQQYMTLRFTSGGVSLIAFGVLFLVVIRFLPEGIVPSLTASLRKRLRPLAETSASPPINRPPTVGTAVTVPVPGATGGVRR
ncbi:branched-chain amino acid ABC transporter permease [Pseudonocardia sp.]|jgi:branched-chain amino acid transport system permease protein|uniref:branched-chain amino acid ABC transporter permease n=1 Tax=Pseudonocardia sp. TaxID=60912 RepID=UPI0031FD14D6